MTTIIDTDKGGQGFQKQRVYLGPSLGWSEEFVQPSSVIVTGTYNVQPGDGLLLVDSSGPTTINLPDVVKWFQQPADQPATGWNRQLCIKDFGGNASTNNITVVPFGGQRIDKFIGPTTITVDDAVFLLVPNVDLTGWIIAAGTTSVLIPVGTFLPVHNPNATGKLTVREVGGNIAAMQGSVAGQQVVGFFADAASVDADVNINIAGKNAGVVKLISNGSVQATVGGPANATNVLVMQGAVTGGFPVLAPSVGGPLRLEDSILVGPPGGNLASLEGSAAGQQGIILRPDASSPDAQVNIHIVPKGNAGVNIYSNGTLQMAVVGPVTSTRYLVVSGGSDLNDPLIAVASGGSIRLDDSILVGPAGGNFGGLFGSAAGGQSVALRADNVANPDANINIDIVPKGVAGTNFYSNGSLQAGVNGPAGSTRAIVLQGSVAGNPRVVAAFGGNVEISSLQMTGTPVAPTVTPATDSTTKVATTAFVQSAIALSGGGAPTGAEYITSSTNPTLTAERVLTNTATISWDFATAGQAKASVVGTFGDVLLAANNPFTGNNTYAGTSTFNGAVVYNNSAIQSNGINGGAASITVTNYQNAAGSGILSLRHSRGATIGTNGALLAGDPVGQINFVGNDGSAFITSAQIVAIAEAAPSGGHIATRFSVTTDNGTNLAERMRLFASGGLSLDGAFATDPGAGGLRLAGDLSISKSEPDIILNGTGVGATGPIIDFKINGNYRWEIEGGIFNSETGSNAGSDFKIWRCTDAGAFTDTPLVINRQNGAVAIKGSNGTSSATAGNVGEYQQALLGSTATLAASTVTNVHSLALTAGDWDVWLNTVCQAPGGGISALEFELSSSASMTGTFPGYQNTTLPLAGNTFIFPLGPIRFLLSASATISLMARASAANTLILKSMIAARRVR